MSIKLKAGDKVKSLVNYYDIAKGDIVTVTHVGFGYINVAESNGSTLNDDEFEVFIQEEPSQMTIESLLKLAKEYAEEAAESQRKSEELYEKADKMYKELRGGADGQVAEEDMSDPANWRARDVVEWLGGVVAPDLTVGGLYIVQAHDGDGRPYLGGSIIAVLDDAGDLHERNANLFDWVNRPSKETK